MTELSLELDRSASLEGKLLLYSRIQYHKSCSNTLVRQALRELESQKIAGLIFSI